MREEAGLRGRCVERGKKRTGERRREERQGEKGTQNWPNGWLPEWLRHRGSLCFYVILLLFHTHTRVTHTPYVCKVTWGHTITNRTPHPSCGQTFAHSARGSLLWLNMIIALSSVCLICHAADCTESEGSLKTRTRGGENERETRGLRKERNKWDGGGGDGGETERESAWGGCGV